MYSNGFVVSIIHKGNVIREIDGKVCIPFGDEYQIRVRNKSNLRAQFEVQVDGTNINSLGRYVIDSGDTITLERFMGSSLNDGRRFKFVSINDNRVSDPTSPDNGNIEVKIWKEKINNIRIIRTNNDPVYIPYVPESQLPYWPHPYKRCGFEPSVTWSSCDYAVTNNTNRLIGANASSSCFLSNSEPGATVEGGQSDQQFNYTNGFQVEEFCTTINLKLVGPSNYNRGAIKIEPYKPRKERVKFCGSCGSRRKYPDVFCFNCGVKYIK